MPFSLVDRDGKTLICRLIKKVALFLYHRCVYFFLPNVLIRYHCMFHLFLPSCSLGQLLVFEKKSEQSIRLTKKKSSSLLLHLGVTIIDIK
jgi:hypothetical protein